jgi:hypothetical protein
MLWQKSFGWCLTPWNAPELSSALISQGRERNSQLSDSVCDTCFDTNTKLDTDRKREADVSLQSRFHQANAWTSTPDALLVGWQRNIPSSGKPRSGPTFMSSRVESTSSGCSLTQITMGWWKFRTGEMWIGPAATLSNSCSGEWLPQTMQVSCGLPVITIQAAQSTSELQSSRRFSTLSRQKKV